MSVVEVAVGTSILGLGMAGGTPGMVLADLGASVVRVVGESPSPIDADVAWGRAWHRDKQTIATDHPERVRALLAAADVALVYGPETLVEARGLGYRDIAPANPGLIYARCRPSRTSKGTVEDFGLLVEAQAGFCAQLAGHRPGPIFVDVRGSDSGAAFLLTTSVLALLRRRAATGLGGWSETSLYDGMLATLGSMIGRSECAAPHVESHWENGPIFPNFLYRCSDGELIQIWFGGKGMYGKLIEVLGDEPSTEGYYTDLVTGGLNERAARWRSVFAMQPRSTWIQRLRQAGVPCEPVLAPGEALSDPHLTEIGLALSRSEQGHRDVVVASPISVRPLTEAVPPRVDEERTGLGVELSEDMSRGGPLADIRVLDFSAFVAGPLGAQVLADLGADVIKVEPPGGEAMRAAAYAVAACQRGKRSLALDVTAPLARPVVERLIKWADVVLHNFRVGVSERLGIDEATVAHLNPRVVYCHASAFGTTGPRATYPGNDALMQAFTGMEWAVGGAGNDPLAPTWIPIDTAGGWVAATGILAGLYAQALTGRGQRVTTSLLGAGMLLQSGVFQRENDYVRQPALDAGQTGYGPGYRIYDGCDGAWFALVLPSPASWERLRALPEAASLPMPYAPLRGGVHDAIARQAEAVLEKVFATAPAADWVSRLQNLDLLAEPVESANRDAFRQGILDDPVNRELGRVASFETADWGHFEQIGPLLRCGPSALGRPPLMLPGVGEHTVAVLTDLGFSTEEIGALLTDEVARQT